jgi:hypothetical protein
MVEAAGFKKCGLEVQWYYLPAELHKNLPADSEVIMGDAQKIAGNVTSFTFFF